MHPARYIDTTDMEHVGLHIKLRPCQYCGMTGTMILHGYIRGLTEYRTTYAIKGRRVFCSNRGRQNGCGRTLSYRLITYLRRSLVSAQTAWMFLQHVLSGMSVESAYMALNPECVLSCSTFFRFWVKFKRAQHAIRTSVSNQYEISTTHQPSAVLETIHHLSLHLGNGTYDPIAGYQKLFQRPFL